MPMKILKTMIKEEWRIHANIFGNLMFAFFPLLIGIGTFVVALFVPYLKTILTVKQMLLLAHYLFLLIGVGIGAFGLFAREFMNRRFGQASLIAYSSRTLPVSERAIFFNFIIKDVIYYLMLWIIPIVLGFVLATPFISINTISAIFACGTLILSFLIGLSIVFFLSTLYAHSSKILAALLLLAAIGTLVVMRYYTINITTLLPSYSMFYQPSLRKILISLLLILLPSTLSLIFLKVDYPEKKKQYEDNLNPLTDKLKFSKYSYYVAKDFLDMSRSEGGVGKIIFSFLFPIVLTWIFLYIFFEKIPTINIIMIFAIFLGIVSSSIYNMLTEFETFNSYMFLPVSVSTVIRSKITSYMLINIISLIILIITAIGTNQLIYFIPALCSFVTISLYSLAMTIYFMGLHPTILLYSAKIFSQYMLSVAPILFIFTIISIINPFALLASPILLLPAIFIIKNSYKKWDSWEPLSF